MAATSKAWEWDGQYVGVVLVIVTGIIISGGVKLIGQVSSKVVPMMALFYLIIAVIILGMNIERVPSVLALIIDSAFDFSAAAGGMFGTLVSKTMLMGIKRGLFSNEAGMGSAPNSAATSDAKHPASQGLIQMLGVFVDTMVVCTCTAVIILMSDNYGNETLKGVELTQTALQYHLGEFGLHFLAFILLLFCYTSIIGNYAYAETNIRYIKTNLGSFGVSESSYYSLFISVQYVTVVSFGHSQIRLWHQWQ
ncbi:transporter [Actinobacillus equuli]|nr:transporter [Actinobacillus equuli]